ncbi:MAG: hypothetical protein AAF798_17215 [Bacteroidota bacterium]
MKYWLLGLGLLLWGEAMYAQERISAAFSLNWWQADLNWPKMWGEPVARMNKSKYIDLSSQFQVGADLAVQKNTRPIAVSDERRLMGSYEGRVPVYLNYFPDENLFIEVGGYIGVVANINDQPDPIIFTQRFTPDVIKMDGGLIGGVGYELPIIGKVFVRYNFGMLRVIPANGTYRNYNRALDVGISIRI